MAAQLSKKYEVDIVHSGKGYTLSSLASAFDVDLNRAHERLVPGSLESFALPGLQSAWAGLPRRLRADRELTLPYDLFIYSGHGVPPFNFARHGMIYCLFPFEAHPAHDLKLSTGWQNRLGLDRWARSAFYRILWQHRLRGYQTILCDSKFTSRWINRLWDKPADVLYPPVELQIPQTKKRNVIVSLGRFVNTDNKNHAQQVRAFREFFSVIGGDWRLHMLGFCADIPQDRAYVQNLRDLALDLPITIVINAERKTVINHLAEAKLFWHTTGLGNEPQALPRSQEHFGIATVEAMLTGCVPLVPNGGGQPEIVEHGENGFLCQDLAELVQHSIRVAQSDHLRSEMSRRAKDASHRFGLAAFEERFGLSVNHTLGCMDTPRAEPKPNRGLCRL
jgi:glycosyltransferase involved in cell wall biosynthesis